MTRLICNLLLAGLIAAVFTVFALAKLYPSVQGWQTVTIRGISMQPTIPLSALAYIEPQSQYAVGDIVSFHTGSTITTHRLVGEWTGDGHTGPWLTQGDGNKAPDAQMTPTTLIVGKVTGYVLWLGFLTLVVQSPASVTFVLVLALTLIYLPSLKRHPG